MRQLLEDVILRLTPLLFLVMLILLGIGAVLAEARGEQEVAGILSGHVILIVAIFIFYLRSDR
jgi:positive regulator of sigma E activity